MTLWVLIYNDPDLLRQNEDDVLLCISFKWCNPLCNQLVNLLCSTQGYWNSTQGLLKEALGLKVNTWLWDYIMRSLAVMLETQVKQGKDVNWSVLDGKLNSSKKYLLNSMGPQEKRDRWEIKYCWTLNYLQYSINECVSGWVTHLTILSITY